MPLEPTYQRFHDLLRDGQEHSVKELEDLLWDDEGLYKRNGVAKHVHRLRREIASRGLRIVTIGTNGNLRYQMTRVTGPGE